MRLEKYNHSLRVGQWLLTERRCMAHPDPDSPEQRPDAGHGSTRIDTDNGISSTTPQPASDGAAPIDDVPVPPLTVPADTKGG